MDKTTRGPDDWRNPRVATERPASRFATSWHESTQEPETPDVAPQGDASGVLLDRLDEAAGILAEVFGAWLNDELDDVPDTMVDVPVTGNDIRRALTFIRQARKQTTGERVFIDSLDVQLWVDERAGSGEVQIMIGDTVIGRFDPVGVLAGVMGE